MAEPNYPTTSKKLGLIFLPNYYEFRVWAPTQEEVFLAIYDNSLCVHRELHPMIKDTDGVHEIILQEDLEGKYYTFIVGECEVTDPYAVALSKNSIRCAIIDLSKTNPIGWERHNAPSTNNACDAIIYEMHLTDFTGYKESQEKGAYLSLVQTDKECNGYQTGLSHLKDLGVTHLQLMPINDFLTVDENKWIHSQTNYNWGYDPEHYNVPEGSYSSNSADPKKRIIELKEMIMSLHTSGFRVILDVVYNHTYRGENSNFNVLVPDYYYRTTPEGKFSDGTGCGNELATERSMVKRYIIDSLVFWASEFKVDGFRFDLMALLDLDTVKDVMKVLKWINKDIMVFGEPWAAGNSVLPMEQRTLKGTQKGLEFALYNDSFRDGIKGGNDDSSKGYIQGNCEKKNIVETGIAGSIQLDQEHIGFAQSPEETLNYINSHDNLILYDKIKTSSVAMDETGRIRLNKLALTILFTSQGIPLLHAGNEFLRTKQMDRNSYKSSLSINEIDWSYKGKYYEFYLYVKDLIALRKSYPCLRMKSSEEIKASIQFIHLDECLILYTIKQREEEFDYLIVIHNPLERLIRIPIEKLFGAKDFVKPTLLKVFDERGLVTTPNIFETLKDVEVGMQASAVYKMKISTNVP